MTKKQPRDWSEWDNTKVDDWGNDRGKSPKWKLKRTWVLKKCKLTGDLILPGTKAWCKTYYHYYNGVPAFAHWVTEEAYTFQILKDADKLKYDL